MYFRSVREQVKGKAKLVPMLQFTQQMQTHCLKLENNRDYREDEDQED